MANPDVLRKILDILRREQAEEGFHIREQWLADTLGRLPLAGAHRPEEA